MEGAQPRLMKASTNAQSLDRNRTIRSIRMLVARLQARSNSPCSSQSWLRNSTQTLICDHNSALRVPMKLASAAKFPKSRA